jgi:hypothetical protein
MAYHARLRALLLLLPPYIRGRNGINGFQAIDRKTRNDIVHGWLTSLIAAQGRAAGCVLRLRF